MVHVSSAGKTLACAKLWRYESSGHGQKELLCVCWRYSGRQSREGGPEHTRLILEKMRHGMAFSQDEFLI